MAVLQVLQRVYLPTFFSNLGTHSKSSVQRHGKICVVIKYFDVAIKPGFMWRLFSKALPHASGQLCSLEGAGEYFQTKE